LCAGFPSPADDYLEGEIDLNRHLIANRPATFLFRVAGDCMRDAGIFDGDLLIVDRSLTLFYAKADKAEAAAKANAKPKALSVAEVQERIGAMIDKRVTRYATVRAEVAPVQVAASE
jgi:Peptidase S24-like